MILLSCGGGGSSGRNRNDHVAESSRQEYCTQPYLGSFQRDEYSDAEKVGDDGLMCWAATAANLLTTAGYTDNEQDTFELFKSMWENERGQWYRAVEWYLRRIDVVPESVTVREYREDAAVDFVVCALQRGEAVMIHLRGSSGGHVVTVSGYTYGATTDHVTLWYAESADGVKLLLPLDLTYNYNKGRWQNSTYVLDYAASLRGE